MRLVNRFLDWISAVIRSYMAYVAKILNRLTGGRLSPHVVTIIGLLAHVPIAILIAVEKNELAAVLLIVFGLFDSLDGTLARLQKRDGSVGMLLDATTDRMKEVLLYTGITYAIAAGDRPLLAAWAAAACGSSLLVPYVKAKGETAIAKSHLSPSEINRVFGDGLMRFGVRVFVLVVGLLSNRLILAVIIIAVMASLTAFDRLIKISRKI